MSIVEAVWQPEKVEKKGGQNSEPVVAVAAEVEAPEATADTEAATSKPAAEAPALQNGAVVAAPGEPKAEEAT